MRECGTTQNDPTDRLALISFDDSERPVIARALHNEPTKRLFVFGIHLARFDEFVLKFLYALWVVLRVKVDCYRIDHDFDVSGRVRNADHVGETYELPTPW